MLQLLRSVRNVFWIANIPLRTQIFAPLSNKELATPELVRHHLLKRLPNHSRVSLVSLYHGKRVRHAIKSCFSQKKTKVFKRVHKIKRHFYSQILGKKLYVRMSVKAFRTMSKYGSFDRYILLSSPKHLDSKIGQYYRQIMMRKINDPEYRIPYVIGSGKKEMIRKYHRQYLLKESRRLVIPKDFKKTLSTYQRKFGTSVDQFAEADYQKFLEVEKLKKMWGKDMDTRHPLLLEIQSKMNKSLSPEQMRAMEQKGEEYKQAYLNHPRNTALRRQSFDFNALEVEKENIKMREQWIKHWTYGEQEQVQ